MSTPPGWYGPPGSGLPGAVPPAGNGRADGRGDGREPEPYAGPPRTAPPPPGAWPTPVPRPGQGPPASWQGSPGPWTAPGPTGPPWPHQASWALPPGVGGPLPRMTLQLPKGTPPHDVPQPYLRAMRSRDWAWWRPLLGLLLFSVVYLVAAVVVVLVAVLTGISPDLDLLDLTDPATLLLTNASLVVAIPVVWLAWAAAHGMRIGWSSSVRARLRWRLFPPLVLRALLTIGVAIGLSVLLGVLVEEGGADVGTVPGYGWLLLVVVLTTPLQSAAEEYVFRGYLSQAIAAWVRAERAGPVVAAVVTAALFSAAHAPPDFLTFLDRFVFGLAASAVTWLTGGLEAAIVLHATNNVLVFVLAGALGSGVTTGPTSPLVGLLSVVLDVLGMGAYVALVAVSRRRLSFERVTAALDLRALPPLPQPAAGLPVGGPPVAVLPVLPPEPPLAPGERSPWARPPGT